MEASSSTSDLIGRTPGGRKLIAIVHADVVGYSRLIGLDDVGTIRRLRTLRRALIDPAIREHGGRIVNTAGDSLLIVFDSVEGALRCAVKVQQQVAVYDGYHLSEGRIRFRVGINAGDVIPDGTDVHGDVVNVTARLQAECPPGGICVSRAVREHVRGRLDLNFEERGQLALKNIARPVDAFVLRLDPTAQPPSPVARRGQKALRLAGLIALILAGGSGTAWWLHRDWRLPIVGATSDLTQTASPIVPPAVGISSAPRLSLVVLPFKNLGGEGLDDDTVDTITEDLTTDISLVPGSIVITRSSAFTYKGKSIDVKRVGEELGVCYAVEGNVRKVDGTLRVNVQLFSTETGTHLWAERFDVSRDGVGYGVDDIVRQIATTLNVRIVDTEAARNLRERPSNPDVADILLRARALYNRPPTPQRQAELVPLYQRALELDPTSVTALVGLAEAFLDNLTGPEDPSRPEKLRHAEELLVRAELLRPDDMMAMWVRVYLLGMQNRCVEAMAAARREMEAYPNGPGARQWLGICLMRLGRAAEAIPELERAIRIGPRNPNIGTRYRFMGYAKLFVERYDEAIDWFQRSLAANPGDRVGNRSVTYAAITVAQALAGHTDQARLSATEAMRLSPTLTVRSFLAYGFANPTDVAQISRMRDAMRLAGIRDHADEDADFRLPSDNILHTNYEAPTPTGAPGARTIRTTDLANLIEQRKPVVLDTISWGRSLPGAIGLWGAGVGGSTSDEFQDRLARIMHQLTQGDSTVPIVAIGFNSERYQGRNLTLRLVALGYTEVYWYRGGREAWEVAGKPEDVVRPADW
jgi:adenylate cyclase